jgi:hypothetical protein
LIATKAIIIGAVPYLAAVLLRKVILGDLLSLESTGQWYTGLSSNFAEVIAALKHPSPTDWPALLVAMMVLPWSMFLSQKSDTVFKIRVGIAFSAIFAVSSAIGIISELRIFIPCAALLVACAVGIASRSGNLGWASGVR